MQYDPNKTVLVEETDGFIMNTTYVPDGIQVVLIDWGELNGQLHEFYGFMEDTDHGNARKIYQRFCDLKHSIFSFAPTNTLNDLGEMIAKMEDEMEKCDIHPSEMASRG